ncbi:hypothetical protein F4679DRAFT_583709 [Xylaria curta]|nr:hypothetical protein F4679DRAFT_583709 [Xylaria curta]
MEDSPLSITASVTGILTFIAAVVAFIYVRYQTVIHGEEEIATITRRNLRGQNPDAMALVQKRDKLQSQQIIFSLQELST